MRIAVSLLGAVAFGAAFAWAWTGGGGSRFSVPVASLALKLSLLADLRAARARRLRWDGAVWWLGAHPASSAEDICGDGVVAWDLGGWLLLRFVGAHRRWSRPSDWVALQRSCVEGDWHALRCALYSPRARSPVAASEKIDG